MRSVVETKEKENSTRMFCLAFFFKSAVLLGYTRDGDLEMEPVKALSVSCWRIRVSGYVESLR